LGGKRRRKMKSNMKNIRKGVTAILFAVIMITSVLVIMPAATAQDNPNPELTVPYELWSGTWDATGEIYCPPCPTSFQANYSMSGTWEGKVENGMMVGTITDEPAWFGDFEGSWGMNVGETMGGTISFPPPPYISGTWQGTRVSETAVEGTIYLGGSDIFGNCPPCVYDLTGTFQGTCGSCGITPEPDCPDADGDGYKASYCGGTDCNDTKPAVYPGASGPCDDGIDNDCDGLIDSEDPDCASGGEEYECIIVNRSPVADANGPYIGTEGIPITFDASSSYDPDGDMLQYHWDFNNDGTWDTGWSSDPIASYTWSDEWSGTAMVEVSDGELTDTDTASVTVDNVPPSANAGDDQIVEQTYYQGADVTLDGSGSNDPDGDPLTYSWTWDDGSAQV
jgi:hypothetical protein